jgi:serine/threonine-protein kinase
MNDAIRRGEVVGGKYRIEGVLGVGAMGIVYDAHHLQLDERVALKVLRSELVAYPEAIKRFSREARAAAKIKNEHVTRVFDVGELDDGTPYIVMESLEGEDLARWIAARGPLRLDEAILFVLQACEALVEAHVLGIVHRDLKPSNLFCSRRPDGASSIKVLDFGISKIAALTATPSDAGRASGGKSVVGSPFYMSPEQMQASHDVDHKADIWAVGVILFELLTTELPFEGGTLPEVCVKVATRPPRSIREIRSEIPEEVEACIFRCLEKDPAKRFESLAEFAGSLFPFAGKEARLSIERIVQVSRKSRTIAARTAAESHPSLQTTEGLTIRPLGATVPPAPPATRHHHLWLGLGGAAAVALGIVLFWTRPMGNGVDSRTVEPIPTSKAAAQPPREPTQPAPVRPENLPKALEPEGQDPTTTNSPRGNVVPASPGATPPPAPGSGTEIDLDEATETKKERKVQQRQASPPLRVRPPAAAPTLEPAESEPGADLRPRRMQRAPRPIDESDPYAK